MIRFHLVLAPALLLAWLVSPPGHAKELVPTVDSVLAKWEEASQKCKTLDAKLTVWKYDAVFGDGHPDITQGRFYYEAPNLGRYEIRKTASGATNDWSCISEAYIWTGKEALFINGERRHCTKFPVAKLQEILKPCEGDKTAKSQELPGSHDDKNECWLARTFGAAIGAYFRMLAQIIQGPREMLPLMVDIRAADVRQRFDVTVEKSGEDILLTAVVSFR